MRTQRSQHNHIHISIRRVEVVRYTWYARTTLTPLLQAIRSPSSSLFNMSLSHLLRFGLHSHHLTPQSTIRAAKSYFAGNRSSTTLIGLAMVSTPIRIILLHLTSRTGTVLCKTRTIETACVGVQPDSACEGAAYYDGVRLRRTRRWGAKDLGSERVYRDGCAVGCYILVVHLLRSLHNNGKIPAHIEFAHSCTSGFGD